MIGKKKVIQIKSLAQKKGRQKEQLFLVEGDKNVLEILNSNLHVRELFATKNFISENEHPVSKAEYVVLVNAPDIKKASLLKNPQNSLALCQLPPPGKPPVKLPDVSFYLDGIQDPGNLGTILRICDWFGMNHLFCSPDTADIYNPKVIQSSMGSFCRINTVYTSFEEEYSMAQQLKLPVFGTFMEGENLYSMKLPSKLVIVLGNEGNGIRREVAEKVDVKLSIPSFSTGKLGAESLNVAVAAGIIASEIRRRTHHPLIQNEN